MNYGIIKELYLILKHTFKKEDFSSDVGHRIKSSFTAFLIGRVGSGIKNTDNYMNHIHTTCIKA